MSPHKDIAPVLYIGFTTFLILILGLSILYYTTPLLIQSKTGIHRGTAIIIYHLGGALGNCHQLPTRTLFIKDTQMPVCARDFGIYMGMLAGAFVSLLQIEGIARLLRSRWLLLFSVSPMAFDGITQSVLILRESSNDVRLLTGLVFGFGLVGFAGANALKGSVSGREKRIAFILGFLVNGCVALILFSAGFLIGDDVVSKSNAISLSVMDRGLIEYYAASYIPEHALSTIHSDPYSGRYHNHVIEDLLLFKGKTSGFGLWAVFPQDSVNWGSGEEGVDGVYAYVDATSGSVMYINDRSDI